MAFEQIDPGDPTEMADALVDRFHEVYGEAPDSCYLAPGRVNLIGEHVDYNEGRCLPMAIPHATYAALARRDDDTLRVTSLQQDEPWTGTVSASGPGEASSWAGYVAGVVWALHHLGLHVPGLDILVDSTVPVGSGLSSSAALECSVAVGVCDLVGIDLTAAMRRELVTACIRAETEVAGAPTGGMDQTVSLFAEEGHALLLDCQDWTTEQVPWRPSEAGLDLLVIDTRASHANADGGYAARRQDCEAAAEALGVDSLREVQHPDQALAGLPDERLRRRARHVFTEMARVDAALEQLAARDFGAFGQTLDASHASLRDDFEVSCAELDVAVATSREQGALGARMTGGGFGGSAIALVPHDRVDAVADAVSAAFAEREWAAPGFLSATASGGARLLR